MKLKWKMEASTFVHHNAVCEICLSTYFRGLPALLCCFSLDLE